MKLRILNEEENNQQKNNKIKKNKSIYQKIWKKSKKYIAPVLAGSTIGGITGLLSGVGKDNLGAYSGLGMMAGGLAKHYWDKMNNEDQKEDEEEDDEK